MYIYVSGKVEKYYYIIQVKKEQCLFLMPSLTNC